MGRTLSEVGYKDEGHTRGATALMPVHSTWFECHISFCFSKSSVWSPAPPPLDRTPPWKGRGVEEEKTRGATRGEGRRHDEGRQATV